MPDWAAHFADHLLLNHTIARQPVAKETFESILVKTLNETGTSAEHTPAGITGADISTLDGKWSLKTQADKRLQLNTIQLHKYMEIGTYNSDSRDSAKNLFIEHLYGYKRLLVLRCHTSFFDPDTHSIPTYELIEIPRRYLMQAVNAEIIVRTESKQNPQPAELHLQNKTAKPTRIIFEGGGERKIRITDIPMSACKKHVTWDFPRKTQ